MSSHVNGSPSQVAVLGEVIWDVYGHARRLGGAPLNFGAHARRMGHGVTLISGIGADELGANAAGLIAELDLDTRFLQTTARFPTGTAFVSKAQGGETRFAIARPAAYDDVTLSEIDLDSLKRQQPQWFYYGTLFATTAQGKDVLYQLLTALDTSSSFYDLNLRPGADSPELVRELLQHADVVKLNEDELEQVHALAGLPREAEAFCFEGAKRYGWRAVGVTLGARGCSILAGGQYVEADGYPVEVVDTVGAGDAFAAAFMHGLSQNWATSDIAAFANRVGALVASRHGAIPSWTLEEAVKL